jgi:asparagine synthase (glutamine-hydrolysing)
MIETLHHRGPDGRGRHVDSRLGLAMGHTRLSIIDLTETGAQPLFDDEAALVLTANGEFYDYKTLRTQMTCRGETFRSKSDSEVALKLYKHQGLDFVHSLRGEFAFALYDGKKDQLILVRDRFGIRPLFYHLTERGIVWGSEVKAVLEHPSVPRRLDKRAALHQMMQCMVPGTSAFEGVQALEPGMMLIVSRQGDSLRTRSVRYWDMDFPMAEDHDPDAAAQPHIDAVTEKLIDAVRARLEADVPVGCYLSGGIDSCSILGLSTAMQQSAVKAFTISFDNDAYDEAAIAREMAQKTGADQELLELSAATLYGDHYVTTLRHAERTFYNTLGVAKWHMSRRVRECGFKVVVTGEGSDELFGGYPFFKRDYFTHAADGDAQARELHAALDESNRVFKGAILSEDRVEHPAMNELCGFTPSWIQPWIKTLERVRPLFTDAVQEELGDYDPIAAIAERIDKTRIEGRHPLDKVQYTWIKTMLEGQILNWGGDRVDMANSMESRPAFLDHHLAELARTIPPNLRIRGGIEKWVLREAMKGVLPQVLYEREKFAFMAPPAHTDERKRQAVEHLVGERMSPEAVGALGLFDDARIRTFLDEHWKGTDPALSARNDIILNHLLGLHIINQELAAGATA